MNTKVLLAVFKRNFVSYFSNPTGYVFVCVFVLLSAFSAFWPNEFFNRNLANLDQLSRVFPLIMLVFIPAITMGIWADERRQGTDELLLTIPAGDFEIVLGKYLAAVAIYSVSLGFSLVCNLIVLANLGSPDVGLFLGTHVGYWLIGVAMLAVGMVASFLTGNLTVSYILGAVFNVPLVFLAYAESFSLSAVANLFGAKSERLDSASRNLAAAIKQWSIADQFSDFGRGIVTLSGCLYFLAIAAVMLYLSMVLIGRRQWPRGRALGMHFLVRTVALALIGLGLVAIVERKDLRADLTSAKLSSLSPATMELLDNLNLKRAVQVEAFISPQVPEQYVSTRLNLLAMLRELGARGKGEVQVRINNTERYSDEAQQAQQRYNITPRRVVTQTRGVSQEDFIFLGVAFTCGLQKVIVPFIDRGISPEYELIRSLATVTEQKRKKVGVLQTDAQLFSRFDMQSMSTSNDSPLIEELKKQYEVVQVDANSPIQDKYDVLLAVQPSSLGPEQMDHFVAAVRNGQPTAIFEDPFPIFSGTPATSAPRQPPGGMNPMMMMGQQRNLPKGDIRSLWNLLGVDFSGDRIVYQNYNPYPKLAPLSERFPEFVFVDKGATKTPFNEASEITSKLQHMLFPFPGSIAKQNTSDLEFTALVRTGDKTGTVYYKDMLEMSMFGMGRGELNPNRPHHPEKTPFVLAVEIRGKVKSPQPMAGADKGAGEDKAAKGEGAAKDAASKQAKPEKKDSEINVVLVADIDVLSEQFFRIREQGDLSDLGITSFDFDNVTFVLDVLDKLAGDNRFLEIRKRRTAHRTLTKIDDATETARKNSDESIKKLRDEFEAAKKAEDKKLEESIAGLKKQWEKDSLDVIEAANRVGMVQRTGEQRIKAKLAELERKRDQEINKIQTQLNLEIRRVQDAYKLWAVILPPIPPLALAVGVFLYRRREEKEGVSRSRLRS